MKWLRINKVKQARLRELLLSFLLSLTIRLSVVSRQKLRCEDVFEWRGYDICLSDVRSHCMFNQVQDGKQHKEPTEKLRTVQFIKPTTKKECRAHSLCKDTG